MGTIPQLLLMQQTSELIEDANRKKRRKAKGILYKNLQNDLTQTPNTSLPDALNQRVHISQHSSQKLFLFIGRFPLFITISWEIILADTNGQLGAMGGTSAGGVMPMCVCPGT
jgi:hypothetical protein